MDLKLVFLSVCVWACAITYSEAGIPKCCIAVKMHVPKQTLAKVQRWVVQPNNGACDISALLLYVKNFRKPICAHPTVRKALMVIQKRRKRSHHKGTY